MKSKNDVINKLSLLSQPISEDEWFSYLVGLARFLRGPQGCPWDQKQKAENFAGFLAEEVEELRETFETNDNEHMEEEFGDVLFCLLAFLAAAEHEGRFTLNGALARAYEKMVRRHGHVFSEDTADTPEDAVAAWNAVKAKEKQK